MLTELKLFLNNFRLDSLSTNKIVHGSSDRTLAKKKKIQVKFCQNRARNQTLEILSI